MGKITEKNSKRRLIIKIIVPIMMVCIIGIVWIVKSNDDKKMNTDIGAIDNKDFELNITEKIDLKKLKSYGLPIIIDFGSDSCIPCIEMAPTLKELNEMLQKKAIIKFADVWKNNSFAEGFPVETIPTQIFYNKDGKPFVPKNPEAMRMTLYQHKQTKEHLFTAHVGLLTREEMLAALKEMGMKE